MTEKLPPGSNSLPGRYIGLWLFIAFTLIAIVAGAAYWKAMEGSGPPVLPEPPPYKESPSASGPGWFREVTAGSGLDFTYRNGEEADQFSILETLGGGIALIDYDRDGLLDIFVAGGGYFDGPDKKQIKGHPCKLYKNLGGFKFKDVTADVGLADLTWWYTHGAAVADYDRDGWPDLLVTGYGRLALLRNEDDGKGHGGRRFVDVTNKVGLQADGWITSAGWADLYGDGFPDLYACRYVNWSFANDPLCPGVIPGVAREICAPLSFKPQTHLLFRNDKGKAFRNVSVDNKFTAEGAGLGVVLADLNEDGRPDIFVSNDMTRNFLYFNRGGKLEEKARFSGVALDEQGRTNGNMGVDVGDYDGSGRPSLWITVFQNEQHVLARNLGRESFLHQSRAAGVAAIGQHYVSFGTSFLDADNDGWEDLVFVSGHVFRNPAGGNRKQRPVFLRNVDAQGRRFFKDLSHQAGTFFQATAIGRSLAVGDLDNDGWPDLVVGHTNSPVSILRNEAAEGLKTPHRWLGVQLAGRDHRDVVGSTVILEGSKERRTRFTKGGGSYLSASDSRLLFGLGESELVRRVTVKWSWGQTQTWDNLEPGHYWKLIEGQKDAERLAYPKR